MRQLETIEPAKDGDPAALFALVDVIEQLSATRTVDQVVDVVRIAARRMAGADGVAFVLRDDNKCHYVDEDAIGPLWKGRRFPMTNCISGWSMMNRQTAVVPDIYADGRIPHDAYRPTFVKSLVMTPVRVENPLGAIGAYWARQRTWTPAELAQLEAVARSTATALENARLYASLTEALERRDLLIRELDHRVKNTLASVQAITFQTRRGAPSPEAFNQALDGRLQALARAHEMLTRGAWARASLAEILTEAIAPFRPSTGPRFVFDGPEVRLAPEAAMTLHMAFYELATNAVRHGALSGAHGDVAVRWTLSQDGLDLWWVEQGGPPVTPPERRGFGSRLLERGLAIDLAGSGTLTFEPDGVRFHMRTPLDSRISLA